MKRKLRYRKSSEVITTRESQLLREIRLKIGISIREVARRLEKSESYLRHIETGRMNVPSDNELERILTVYKVSLHQFKIRLKTFEPKVKLEECVELLKKLDESELENCKKYLELLLSRP